jgi:hypothetical protein
MTNGGVVYVLVESFINVVRCSDEGFKEATDTSALSPNRHNLEPIAGRDNCSFGCQTLFYDTFSEEFRFRYTSGKIFSSVDVEGLVAHPGEHNLWLVRPARSM